MICRSCKAPIVFAAMATSGKQAPFERDDAAGLWSIVDGIATHVGPAPATPVEGTPTAPRYTSHFARCPSAQSWRRR